MALFWRSPGGHGAVAGSRADGRPRRPRPWPAVSSLAAGCRSFDVMLGWASMSAATTRGSPSWAMMRISLGPATKSIPPRRPAASWRRRRRCCRVRRCDPPGDGARAEGEGRDGVRAAHLEDVRNAEHGCHAVDGHHGLGRATTMRGTPATCAGSRHHQRGGQRIAAGGNVGRHGV